MRRLQRLADHLAAPVESNTPQDAFLQTNSTSSTNAEDVVIVCALRTAIGKAKTGAFKDTHPGDLLSAVLKGILERTNIDPQLIGDIVVGNAWLTGSGATMARQAQFVAGYPETVPIHCLSRQCASGLQAVAEIAASIKAGYIDIGIGAGFESMSKSQRNPGATAPSVKGNKMAMDCLMPMGITSENVAARYGITREEQDQFGLESQNRALRAQKGGNFDAEIIPVKTKISVDLVPPKQAQQQQTQTQTQAQTQTQTQAQEGKKQVEWKELTVTKDDGVRPTTIEALRKLKPAFLPTGSTTAGQSSQMSDGAGAVLLMRRSVADQLNMKPIGIFRGYSVIGCAPAVMGIGPSLAIPSVLKQCGLSVSDIDVFELNEAFASQALFCIDTLGLPKDKVNPNGGAIALGHPLGCTGARQISTALNELKRRKGKYAVISMCVGTGMGAAAVLENCQ